MSVCKAKIWPAENQKRRQEDSSLILRKPVHVPVGPRPSLLTVWKRSSMTFQGTDGFTVFDDRGRLVFRVDNYTRKSWSVGEGGLVLMDGSGQPVLTLKPQLLSMQHQWNGYRGELDDHEAQSNSSSRAFRMRRTSSGLLIHTSSSSSSSDRTCEAEVFLGSNSKSDLKCEGSFRRRNSRIKTTASGQLVAKISRKRVNTTLLLSDDVFTLTVQPEFDPALAMAFVIILDRICSKPFAPVLCSYN